MRITVPAYALEGNLERYRAYPSWYSSPLSYDVTSQLANYDSIWLSPILIAKQTTVTKMGIQVMNLGADMARVGIYGTSVNMKPYNLIQDAGEMDISTIGYKQITGLSIILLPITLYWTALLIKTTAAYLACMAKSDALGIMGSNAGGAVVNTMWEYDQAYGALPATLTEVALNNRQNYPPCVGMYFT